MDTPEKNATRAKNIRTLWDALQGPSWSKDDLIDLGKALYARTPLRNLDPEKFDRILPHLIAIVDKLEAKLTITISPDEAAKTTQKPEHSEIVPPEENAKSNTETTEQGKG